MRQDNKRILPILLTTIMLFSAGCTQQNNSTNKNPTTPSESTPEATVVATAEDTGTPITVGSTITTNDMEITINKAELTYDVLPDDTSGFYSHYEADAGNVYLHLDTNIKNLAKQNLSCDKLGTVTADYNGGYTYTGQAIPEDSTTGFTYANITSIKPLETLGVHFIFKCPQEVAETQNPLFITFEPSNSSDRYIITIR
ncbi:MAG: hypothetical protein HFI75_00655 [Lachnospiraceae bacterium]|nr:hypothetical protein [Lachnospiraceae bacterium]